MATEESNPWENLPDDLIVQILLRLPIKSLLRFRSISKSWLSLISSPQFKNTHLKISTSRKRLIYGSRTALCTISLCPKFDDDPSEDNVPFDYAWDDSIKIVGSCNGLVCIVLRGGSVIVCNPSIRKYRQLPVSPKYNFFRTCYGFGYDASNDDYKVVELGYEENTSRLSIYSLRDDSWKMSDWSHGMIPDGPGVFVNGAIHWTVHYIYGMENWDVVAQSLTTGNCSSFALPVRPNECPFAAACWLGVSGERLCASFDHRFFMDVWVMMEYGVEGSWSKVACLLYLYDMKDLVEALLVTEDGGVLLRVASKLVWYRPFAYRKIRGLSDVHTNATTYIESFVSPDLDLVEEQTSHYLTMVSCKS